MIHLRCPLKLLKCQISILQLPAMVFYFVNRNQEKTSALLSQSTCHFLSRLKNYLVFRQQLYSVVHIQSVSYGLGRCKFAKHSPCHNNRVESRIKQNIFVTGLILLFGHDFRSDYFENNLRVIKFRSDYATQPRNLQQELCPGVCRIKSYEDQCSSRIPRIQWLEKSVFIIEVAQ